jgi:adenylyltransferase/sulfurtransferase
MMLIAIPADVLAAVYAHATRAFPDECCGYLCGPRDGDAVDEAIACTNMQVGGDNPFAPERGADSGFVIGGRELLAFARTFDSPRPARVVYHSHPSGEACFSSVDRAAAAGPAYPVQHLVVGITVDGVTEAVQLAWSDDARDYVEIARWKP